MEENDSGSDARRRKREQRILKNSSARLAKITYNWSSDNASSESTDVPAADSNASDLESVGRSGDNISALNATMPKTGSHCDSLGSAHQCDTVNNRAECDTPTNIDDRFNSSLSDQNAFSSSLINSFASVESPLYISHQPKFEFDDVNSIVFSTAHLMIGAAMAIISLQFPLYNLALLFFVVAEMSLGYFNNWRFLAPASPSMFLTLVSVQFTQLPQTFLNQTTVDWIVKMAAVTLNVCNHLGIFLCGYFCIHYMLGSAAELGTNEDS